ncbi:hypothetical protein J1N35_015896 [Gossypium stocksii]|uniref:Uncharacterized protein n=1 Tax=Gossypium stocksii TaxID=47602 RepID=A0A9D4AAB3_9ROSI|nr:hypothetical protein J1N35_015896 [Gossypium stocksii]
MASSPLSSMESLRVRDIQPADSAWDVPLVDGLMVPSNVSRILGIPVSLFPTSDRLIWHDEKHGIFMVKYAYHLAFDTVESGRYAAIDGPWLKLWNSTFPLKV